YQASMLIVAGVLAALYHRERTGEGQKFETSLLQGIMSIQAHFFVEALECDEEGALGIYPYRFFDTQDDLIFIAAGTDKFWCMLCVVLGVPELGTDPLYNTNSKRAEHREKLTAILQPIFALKTSDEWEALLIEKGIPCGAVKDYLEFLNDPQVLAMEMNPIVDHPLIGPMRMAGVPIHFEKTPCEIQRHAPMLGQHTDEILREIGFGEDRITKLYEKGIIGRHTEKC
ncbi:MAG: CoA transferase, partial [Acidobacteria bacterium]|nr:CoA transferase [Acidobacteriota bacterium]